MLQFLWNYFPVRGFLTKLPESELSPSEIEVLRLNAEGTPNAEIAAKLFVSEKTVKSHVSNILSKLHLQNRTQAAIFAWRNRLI